MLITKWRNMKKNRIIRLSAENLSNLYVLFSNARDRFYHNFNEIHDEYNPSDYRLYQLGLSLDNAVIRLSYPGLMEFLTRNNTISDFNNIEDYISSLNSLKRNI